MVLVWAAKCDVSNLCWASFLLEGEDLHASHRGNSSVTLGDRENPRQGDGERSPADERFRK